MQFFPVTPPDFSTTAVNVSKRLSVPLSEGFETVYSSFIEEGRDVYTGIPQGFSTYDQGNGTVSKDTMGQLKKELEKYGAHGASLSAVEVLTASDTPITIGRIIGTLSGNSRLSDELDSSETDHFSRLMKKIGFSKEDVSDLLELSDTGKNAELWERIQQKLEQHDQGGLVVESKEFSALLRGLDISSDGKKRMETAFSEANSSLQEVSSEELIGLLTEANAEINERVLAAKVIQTNLQAAVKDTIQAAKLDEISKPSADKRGNARSDAVEQKMKLHADKTAGEKGFLAPEEDSQLKAGSGDHKAGDDAHKTGQDHKTEQDGADSFGSPSEGKSRSERILSQTKEMKEAHEENGSNSKKSQTEADQAAKSHAQSMQSPFSNMTSSLPSEKNIETAHAEKNLRQEIFSQVDQGVFQNLTNGAKQLTLQVTPESLGQVTVVLSMHQGELRALFKTDSIDATEALQEQMAELKAAFEEQGIKVAEIDVETNVAEDYSARDWSGQKEQNFGQTAQERALFARLGQLRKENAVEKISTLDLPDQASKTEAGLHVVA